MSAIHSPRIISPQQSHALSSMEWKYLCTHLGMTRIGGMVGILARLRDLRHGGGVRVVAVGGVARVDVLRGDAVGLLFEREGGRVSERC